MRLGDIAAAIGGKLEGDAAIEIIGVSGLSGAHEGEISFVTTARYAARAESTSASALVVGGDYERGSLPLIRVGNPEGAVVKLVELFRPPASKPSGTVEPGAFVATTANLGKGVTVMPNASICDGAMIGAGTVIHPGVCVGAQARIGAGCVLHANVVVGARCVLGDHVVIHPGAVIGADGFGYRPTRHGLRKLEHIGIVEIGDDAEIGANTTIDRARVGRTVVGRGVKIDNLVQVAHNCRIGAHALIISQVGLSGSCEVGQGAMLGGQVGIADHVRIGAGALIGSQSGVGKDIPDSGKVLGSPAIPHMVKKREEAAIRRLPELLKRVRELEKRLGARDDGKHDDQ